MRRLARAFLALVALILGRRRRRPTGPEPPPARELETGPHRRAENVLLACLGGAVVAGAAFLVFYVAFPNTQLLGLSLGLALAALGAAAVVAGRGVVPQETAVEEREDFGDPGDQRDVEEIVRESGAGISRRKLIVGAAGAAGATVGAATLFPAASFGPRVGRTIRDSPWRAGRRVVDSEDRPVRADEVEYGSFVTGFPEGAEPSDLGASVIVVRLPLDFLRLSPKHRAGAPEGFLAYSKVCPHAGCAVSMYRHPLHPPTAPSPALVCPCHYSTFDPARGGEVVFGPASRNLPQLPLRINGRRELEAAGDYYDPIGPSYSGSRRQ